ncbi:TPA: hypothetical protein RJD83_002686 [Legionella pneumophila]|nr:hypothetical protein [Legionella pneumophila]
MITRDQIYTMLMMRKRNGSFFSALPIELIQEISDYGQDPNSAIATALHHAAYARKEDVDALLALLDINPRLLLQAGNVQTPGGDEVRRVTIYEFLLGAGDYELAEVVQAYFDNIPNGEQERIRQYERYKPHIQGMLDQNPYDLKPLIELIKNATPAQVQSLLSKDMTGEDALCKAFIQFRKDWAPKVLTEPCMHYNYASLNHAFKLINDEWSNLYKASNQNFDQINLVWRQLIGFEMRRLPGFDRCVMALGLDYIVKNTLKLPRTYYYNNLPCTSSRRTFPVTLTDESINGLGGDFAVSVLGWPVFAPGLKQVARCYDGFESHDVPIGRADFGAFSKFMSNKKSKLAKLDPNFKPWCCVIN